jgi:hypothetical protein
MIPRMLVLVDAFATLGPVESVAVCELNVVFRDAYGTGILQV